MNLEFGELRGVFHGSPSRRAFLRVCRALEDAWRQAPGQVVDELVPFVRESARSWPGHACPLPVDWTARWLSGELPDELMTVGRTIRIKDNTLWPDDVEPLARLTHIVRPTGLRLRCAEWIFPDFVKFFAGAYLDELAYLDVSYNYYIGEAGTMLHCLADAPGFPKLRHLDAGSLRHTPEAIRALDGAGWARGLERLDLESCQLREECMAALAESERLLEGLESLSVRWDDLDNGVVRDMMHRPAIASMRVLRLEHCQLGNAAATAIAESPHLVNLEVLSLRGNKIGAGGVSKLASSKNLSTVRDLDISEFSMTQKSAKALGESIHLGSLRAIRMYNLPSDSALGPSVLDALLENRFVRHLGVIEANLCSTIGAEQLDAMAASEELRLEEVDASFWRGDGADWGRLFASEAASTIERLDLSNTEFAKDPVAFFSNAHPDLRLKALKFDGVVGEAFVKAFALPAFDELEELDISTSSSTPASVFEAIAESPMRHTLRKLKVSGWHEQAKGIGSLFESDGFAELEVLDLSRVKIDAQTLEALCDAQHIQWLHELNLGHNDLGEDAIIKLFSSHHMRRLGSLNVEETGMGRGAFIEALGCLPTGAPLFMLDLSRNDLGDLGIRAFAERVHFPNLVTLYLGSCGIGDDGLRALARSEQVRRLTGLNLGGNAYGSEGSAAMAASSMLSERLLKPWL